MECSFCKPIRGRDLIKQVRKGEASLAAIRCPSFPWQHLGKEQDMFQMTNWAWRGTNPTNFSQEDSELSQKEFVHD